MEGEEFEWDRDELIYEHGYHQALLFEANRKGDIVSGRRYSLIIRMIYEKLQEVKKKMSGTSGMQIKNGVCQSCGCGNGNYTLCCMCDCHKTISIC